MISRLKKVTYTIIACLTLIQLITMPISTKVSAENNVVVDLSIENQEIRGFGGMNHSLWIGDLTPEQRETAFLNGEDQIGFSILRIPIHENRDYWHMEVETAKAAIENGAIVFASPWNPPDEMTETVDLGIREGEGTIYEAENGTILNDAVIDNNYPGYTGSGYVDFQAESDAYIQWSNVIIGIEGTKDIRIRYALESGTRYVDVYLNDEKIISDLAFEETGSWSNWGEKSIQIPMSVGNDNRLKLVTNGTEGPNIDHINLAAYTVKPSAQRLKHDMYDEYAQYLNEFDSFMKNNGVDLHAISIQNEPDYADDWTWWTPEEVLRFMKENAGTINTKVIAPESFSYVKKMSDPILNDPEALANMDILGAHLYGTHFDDFSYPLFKEKGAGKELWMTEVYYPNSDMTSGDKWPEALDVAHHIHHALADGDFQAYVWWYIRRGYSPIAEDGTISKRGYSMAHYSKFVRPGYVRVEATKNPEPDVYTSAYKGDDKVVIVAVNRGATEVNQNFTIQNGNISQVSSWVTNSDRNMVSEPDINASEGSFSAQLPAQSVTTFVTELNEEIETAELEHLLIDAKTIENNGDYTIESYESLQELIAEVETILTDDEATQEDINAIVNRLREVMENLEVLESVLNTEDLERVLEKAKVIKESKYTNESFESLQKLIAEAEIILVADEVTQKDINAMVHQLQAAMGNLEILEVILDTEELEKVLEKAKASKEDKYTKESFKSLQELIAEAAITLANDEATQEEINALAKALKDGLANLEKVENSPTKIVESPVSKEDPKIDELIGSEGEYLPKTATNTYLILLSGAILIVLGSITALFMKTRKVI